MSESDVGTPIELPPAVSLQAPLEESAKKMVHAMEPLSAKAEVDTKSAEAQVHMEESWVSHPVETATTAPVMGSFPAPQMVTAVVSTYSFHSQHSVGSMRSIVCWCAGSVTSLVVSFLFQNDTAFDERHGGHVSSSFHCLCKQQVSCVFSLVCVGDG